MDFIKEKAIFEKELVKRREKVYNYLISEEYIQRFSPEHIRDAVYSYINMGGKSLRPAVLLFSCGAVGGEETKALPAAAAIEVYHTWTLVHDDIIDKDEKRRGGLTIHEEWRRKAIELGYDEEYAKHYGLSVAILAGDVQHGWSISLFCELHTKYGVSPSLTLYLIDNLQTYVMSTLVEGETLDVQFSRTPLELLSEEAILEMLWKKTGVLYEFAGRAGAMIGLDTGCPDDAWVKAISQFAAKCGMAFQLQDDILGVIGSEDLLGKPVGSDIREGKRTIIVHRAFQSANEVQKRKLLNVLGNQAAREDELREIASLLNHLGGIEYTKKLARSITEEAAVYLEKIPESDYKDLLLTWARYIVEREF